MAEQRVQQLEARERTLLENSASLESRTSAAEKLTIVRPKRPKSPSALWSYGRKVPIVAVPGSEIAPPWAAAPRIRRGSLDCNGSLLRQTCRTRFVAGRAALDPYRSWRPRSRKLLDRRTSRAVASTSTEVPSCFTPLWVTSSLFLIVLRPGERPGKCNEFRRLPSQYCLLCDVIPRSASCPYLER